MSTVTDVPVTQQTHGVLNSTRAELLRLRKWPAVWVTIGAWFAMNAMFGYIFDYITYTSGTNNFSNEGEPRALLLAKLLPTSVPDVLAQGMPMFGGAIMMVLGAIVAGNGYGWGTWKTVLTQGPSRTSTLLGSLAATTAFVGGIVVLTLVSDGVMALGVALAESQPTTLPAFGDTAQAVGVAFLVLEMWALAGYLLGTVARGPALAVGLGLLWALVIENLLRGVGTSLAWVDAFTHVLPQTASGSMVGQMIGDVGGPNDTPGILTTLSFDRGLWTTIAYVVAFPFLTWLLVRRRDVV